MLSFFAKLAEQTMPKSRKRKEKKQKHICHLVHTMKIGTKGIVELTHFLTFAALNNLIKSHDVEVEWKWFVVG